MNIDALRAILARAVTDAGMPCAGYPPDSATLPGAWVDTITFDWQTAASFCASAESTAVIITAAQRNDRAAGLRLLEALIPDVTKNVEAAGPIRVLSVESGTTQIGTVDVPAVLYRVAATIAT